MGARSAESLGDDLFDGLLNLEDQFYDDGYRLGLADGAQAGRIEGRTFGLEKGLEKYRAMGKLHGKSTIWAGRLPRTRLSGSARSANQCKTAPGSGSLEQSLNGKGDQTESHDFLATLSANPRLEKHIQTLYALSEPASLSTQNTEDAVSDFDDRYKRAAAKAKIVEKLVAEEIREEGQTTSGNGQRGTEGDGGGSIEDVSVLKARH
ncbi:hypothetical protein L228DRAFT_259091 [Xylona heveae TC161]|uniref:Essential protein Yae1 N-terminal domain-containing protein n=1 Tax=Xylona heveae (strain CBS 132557 / TC161) TaxID=1328760 RepID=A0A165J432_XYLHT|nr:hypothetical protein L228DRAFT_259091 [Xylona heveae TC161]KZF25701.1 hypothetical protein L228DRAFT_259091 [Xylona heveae TC161]